jgi:hypothetical protein
MLRGRVAFELSRVRYINSVGGRMWGEMLARSALTTYEFWACSVPFMLQATVRPELLGTGSVETFFAPYRCEGCFTQGERLLHSATLLATGGAAPRFGCSCGGEQILDDDPDRYLAFLVNRAE